MLIVLAVIILFLIFALSKINNANKEITKCESNAQQFYNKERVEKQFARGTTVSAIVWNSHVFSQSLKTCLVTWQESFQDAGVDGYTLITSHITDIYNNRDIYVWYEKKGLYPPNNSLIDSTGSYDEYMQKLHYYGFRL